VPRDPDPRTKVKSAPFSKHLRATGEIRVYFGSRAWNNARIRNSYCADALVFPDGESPNTYRWPVCGKDVLLLQAGLADIKPVPELAHALIASGATIVRVVYGEDMAIYRSSRRVAA
jgi:hypothetical protein